jgi:hypothetical protein
LRWRWWSRLLILDERRAVPRMSLRRGCWRVLRGGCAVVPMWCRRAIAWLPILLSVRAVVLWSRCGVTLLRKLMGGLWWGWG